MGDQTDPHAPSISEANDHRTPRLNENEDEPGKVEWSSPDSPDSSKLRDLRLDDNDDEKQAKEEEDPELAMYTEYGFWIDEMVRQEMEMEKKLYPGASTWARDEERLFEILYLRQELPILPSFWGIDFRGIPISERCFSTDQWAKPIIYAHCREFRATMALTRLIDLTANVRTVIQCGLPHKAPIMVKKCLDSYITWAAQDGSFSHLEVVPNIIAEIIDSKEGEAGVTRIIENRMRALARLQREYLKINREVEFESPGGGGSGGNGSSRRGRGEKKDGWKARAFGLMNVFFKLFETGEGTGVPVQNDGMKRIKLEPEEEELRLERTNSRKAKHKAKLEVIKEEDEDTPISEYRRRPPVVYGLFIVRTSVFIMTVDSSRGDTGYVSFHVDIDLKDYKQSVWNALTMAMVICVARDEMMSRLGDFDVVNAMEESDVDA
ncbi:hypothetical protein PT974_12060 [Cladobotryum mycophilum]|uniref:Uncharacterized protein n=1 Tax=Cladobotryum mycophilum TaxID=491253 RepID=A0ABR0S6Y6_9HYPO